MGQNAFLLLEMISKAVAIILLTTALQHCSCQENLDDQNTFLSNLFNVSIEDVGAVANNFHFINVPRNHVTFYFYPSDGSEPVPISSENSTSLMDPDVDTKIIIHGWNDNALLPWIRNMSALYHEKGKYNVVAPDWSKDAAHNYVYAASAIQGVGYIIGDFIVDIAQKHNEDFLQIVHVIGHSMGGQCAGFAGQRVITKLGEKITRISGLDVASPLFEIPIDRPPDLRLSPTDADFTDLIHTQLGFRGLILPAGKVDFYVNTNKIIQPGCSDDLPDVNGAISCGHQASHFYFSRTILDPKLYKAVKCLDFDLHLCYKHEMAYMGDGVSERARGTFYVRTDANGDPVDA